MFNCFTSKWFLVAGFFACVMGTFHAQALSPRERQLIDRDWNFSAGDYAGAEVPGYDDTNWQRIGLPHSFGLPYFGATRFYVGYGWYRKHLAIKTIREHNRYCLEFEGVFQDADVFVNGQRIGDHQGGYTGFSMDITHAIHAGDNIVAVRVNNLWNALLNPRAGEHNFNGGIYRNVYLVTTSDLHVDWYGTFVTTPGLSKSGGPVYVATELRNESARPRHFLLETDIVDHAGKVIATATSEREIAANSMLTIQQKTASVASPELWSPARPYLYEARARVWEGKKLTDSYVTSFGFRWIEWTADRGFFLNGEHYYFHGADVHQDHAGWGDAVTNDGIARDVRLVKAAGMDFIRGSHYPHSPVFSDECDKQGVLLWSENSFWGTGGEKKEGFWTASAYPPNEIDQKPFEENVKRSLLEMIRMHRNHPSIIAWSLTNEVFFSDAALLPKVRHLLGELVEQTHRFDPTRPAAAGGVQRGDLDKIADVAGYNGDGAKLFPDPGVPNVVTEYGSTEAVRPGAYDPGWGDIKGQPEYAWRSGQALWSAFDHGSIFRSMGTSGMVDYFRLPKRQWYWYRHEYLGIPEPAPAREGIPAKLALTSDKAEPLRADGTGDVQLIVAVKDAVGNRLSNSPPVDLEVLSGPGEFPTGRSIRFLQNSEIPIRDGEAAIEMRSYQGGVIHLRASSPGLQPAELEIVATGGPKFLQGVTPVAPSRKQVSYGGERLQSVTRPYDISLNRPTLSSSDEEGHKSGMANDGNRATYWRPIRNADESSWWAVNFESTCTVAAVHADVHGVERYGYRIEISDHNGDWKTVLAHNQIEPSSKEIYERLPAGTTAKYLRIVFLTGAGDAPTVDEVTVIGVPLQ